MYFFLIVCAIGARLATASTLSVLSTGDILHFVTELNDGQAPLAPQGGCTPGRVQDAQQAYNDAITVANLANSALTQNPILGRVNNMFQVLFGANEDAGRIAEFYQVIADTAGPQTDQTPENIILQCEDFLFDELIKHGKAKNFDDNGSDPCNDIDVNAYGFFVESFPEGSQDEQTFGALVGEHIVLCNSFFQLQSLANIPQQIAGSDMAPANDDDINVLENTRPGIMLHELTHRVLNTQGVVDTVISGVETPTASQSAAPSSPPQIVPNGFAEEQYGIISAVRLVTNPDPNNAISLGRENADTYNLFGITLIDQAKDFDWSGQGNTNNAGQAALPAPGE